MTYDEVEALAGSKVAVFCKDYKSMYATVTPVTKQRRGTTLYHLILLIYTIINNK